MDPQEIFVVAQAIEAMDSTSSSSEYEDDDELDDLDDILLLQSIYADIIETESHAKIRNYVDEVVSLYSDTDVSIYAFIYFSIISNIHLV